MLRPDRAALVVVDLQEKLLPAIAGRERVVAGSRLLLRLARTLKVPVVFTTQYAKGLGALVAEIAAEAAEATRLDKTSFGCFGDPAFSSTVAGLGRDQLLLCGVETHICVMQTALGALETGYEVHVAADAVGARHEENHRLGLARMERSGAILSSTEMAVYEMLERSDTAAFKEMLPFLKG